MRILRQCFTPTHSNYLVYDETKPFDEEEELLRTANYSKEKRFLDLYRKNLKVSFGRSWGFVKLCYFTITNKGEVTIEFNQHAYNLQDLKKIMSKIYKTRLRLMKKWEELQ